MLDTIGCRGHKWADFSCNSGPVNYYKHLTPWCRLGFNARKWDSWEILARLFPQFLGNVKTEKKLTWVLFIKKCSLLMNTKHLGSIAHVPTSELTLWDCISTVTHFVWCGLVYAHIQKKEKSECMLLQVHFCFNRGKSESILIMIGPSDLYIIVIFW